MAFTFIIGTDGLELSRWQRLAGEHGVESDLWRMYGPKRV
jgi:hypothetical protein